jgi:glutathione-regulated potassium-efflux system ancillary protein KefC/glutathione-regulated potassium-efflux system protein KefB
MAVTPLLLLLAEHVILPRVGTPSADRPAADAIDTDHPVIIAGFGGFGSTVGRFLRASGVEATVLDADPQHVEVLRRLGLKVFYGDASRLDLLRAAGAERAELLVLAIDDVAASVRTAQMVRRHFPKLRILARVRNRQHAFALMNEGVTDIWRETYGTSLELAEATLVGLGTEPALAADQVRRFREHDEQTLAAQAAVVDDETKLIATAQAASRQLEELFKADVVDATRAGRPGRTATRA